jgi:hypothetical protein
MFLLEIVYDAGILGTLIRLVRASIKISESKVKFQTQLTEQIKIRQGFKQDDELAPISFSLTLEYVIMNV